MRKITLFLSLLLAFAGATKTQAQALKHVTAAPETGIYVIYSVADNAEKAGYWYNESEFASRPFRASTATDFATTGITAENLKFCWLLVKNDDGTFTLQNLASLRYVPANNGNGGDFGGSETANLQLEEATDATDGDWYMYETNYAPSDGKYYVHTNKAQNMDPNMSYWKGRSATGSSVRLTFYSLPSDTERAIIAAAAPNFEGLSGDYVGARPAQKFEALQADPTLQNLIDYVTASPIAFDADKYYRIVCVSPKANAEAGTARTAMSRVFVTTTNGEGVTTTTDVPVTVEPSQSDASQIWQFVSTGGDNSYKLKNLNDGRYISPISAGNYRAAFVEADAAGVVEILAHGDGQFKIHNKNSADSKHCLFCENNTTDGYTISGWDNGKNTPSAWRLYPVEDIELTLNSADGETYWSTGYLPFAVTAGDADAKVYTAARDAEDATVLNLTEAADGVAAGQGFVVKGTAAQTTLSVLYDAASAATSEMGGTLLGESGIDQSAYYVLSNGSQGVGLYHPNVTELLANKAYLEATGAQGVSAFRFSFGGGVTGIGSAVTTPSADDVYYDLSGRRVTAPVRGIYVKNGRKVLVR